MNSTDPTDDWYDRWFHGQPLFSAETWEVCVRTHAKPGRKSAHTQSTPLSEFQVWGRLHHREMIRQTSDSVLSTVQQIVCYFRYHPRLCASHNGRLCLTYACREAARIRIVTTPRPDRIPCCFTRAMDGNVSVEFFYSHFPSTVILHEEQQPQRHGNSLVPPLQSRSFVCQPILSTMLSLLLKMANLKSYLAACVSHIEPGEGKWTSEQLHQEVEDTVKVLRRMYFWLFDL